jgi:hypothetical protein
MTGITEELKQVFESFMGNILSGFIGITASGMDARFDKLKIEEVV